MNSLTRWIWARRTSARKFLIAESTTAPMRRGGCAILSEWGAPGGAHVSHSKRSAICELRIRRPSHSNLVGFSYIRAFQSCRCNVLGSTIWRHRISSSSHGSPRHTDPPSRRRRAMLTAKFNKVGPYVDVRQRLAAQCMSYDADRFYCRSPSANDSPACFIALLATLGPFHPMMLSFLSSSSSVAIKNISSSS